MNKLIYFSPLKLFYKMYIFQQCSNHLNIQQTVDKRLFFDVP